MGERFDLPLAHGVDEEQGRSPHVRVRSIRVSGGFAWVLLLPLVVLGATFAALGVAALGMLGLVAAPRLFRRHRQGSTVTHDGQGAATIELSPAAYQRIDGGERR